MEWRSGVFAASTFLCLFSLCNLVVSEDDQEIMDNDNSRKLLGSSVVTSVSVIMEHGNGSKTVIKDGTGVNPQIVGTPGSFLSPDRYEFYSLDDSGDLVKRLMSLEEIQSLIAASRPELAAPNIPIYYHRPLVEPDIADEGVQNVLANVQSVLREELAKERDPPKPQPLPIDDSWSLLLPGLFGADLDFKQEPMLSRPVQPTTDSFPSSVPTDYSSNQDEASYAQVPQGTTFGVLPPLTHSQTTPKPFESPTTKPVKYSAHYTTVKTPLIPEKQPENNLQTISTSTMPPKMPPKTSSSTIKPSTIIHYLPIQSIEPASNNLGQKPKPKPDKNKPEFTTSSPVKKTTPAHKIPPKLTTPKPTVFTQEYNYNKTYQRITVKPNTNKQPSQSSKPIKSTQKPTTSSSSFKPHHSSSKPQGTSSKPYTKPYIKTTRKPDVNFATEYQIVETVGTRRPPTAVVPHSTTAVPVKKPSPTKGTYGQGSKNPTHKPSVNKPPNTGKPLLSSTSSDNLQQVKPSLTTNHQSYVHKTEAPLKSTVKPSVGPVKVTLSQSTKPVKPLKTTPATTKLPPSTTVLPTSSVSNPKPSSTTPPNSLADTIELMPITQDDEVMASSAAALIQDLLRTETNKDLFTKPTSYSTVSGNPMTSFPSTLLTTTIKTRPTTFVTSRTPITKRPTQYSTKPTNNSPVINQKYTSTDRTTLTTSFNYNMTRKPIIQKFPSPHTVSPVSRRPPQPTTKPTIQTTQTFRPFTTSKEPEKLSDIKSESLTQKNPTLVSNQLLSGSQKKPTEITLIPINDLKKYSSLSQLINAKPDIVEKRTTTPPSTKATSTSLPTTVKKKDDPVTTVMPTTSYSESENDLINSDMIYQVISTLQSNTNKITYPTTVGDYITSTMRTFETEATTNTDSSDPLITTAAATEVFNLKLKNKENIKLKLKPTEKNPESSTGTTDNWSYTQPITSVRTTPTKLISTKPTNHQTEKINNNIQNGWKFGNIITTSAHTEMQTEMSSTLSEELTSTMTTSYDETTTELSTQDTSTNYLEDEAIQEGISAVANLLLDDSNMLRHMGKPDNSEDFTSTTDYTTTEGIPSTTSDNLDTTTELDDLSLLRMDMSTDEYDPSDSDLSTTMDPISTTSTDSIIPTTTEMNKFDQKAKEEIMQNDGEITITTMKVTTKATTIVSSEPTSRTPTKAPVSKIKTNLSPTKESKLNPDDPIEATLTTQSQHKVNTTTKEKQKNKVSTNRPVKYTTPKPLSLRLPGEKPTRMPLPKLNKTSSAHVNSTSPVKTELKNVLNDKFFKKPGVNSYQPNVQPPPSIDLHPAPQESLGLEASTAFLQEDIKKFSDLLNEIGFRLWTSISGKGGISSRSFVLSPFAATSMLAMVFLGARGPTSGQMNDILRLDDMVTFNPHQVLKNVTESVINSKNLGVATASFVRELYSDKFKGKILDFYKERVHQYYDGHVEEVNFNAIGDIVRRRTNLLVKRQTLGKLPEYLRGSSLNMRPPLAAFTANIFQSDCEAASTEGRDGEMYFVVRPSTRQRRLVPVPAVVWRTSFLAGYEPSLDATSVCLGADSVVSTILVLPGQQGQVAPGDGLARLEQRLIETSFRRGSWSKLLRSLLPRPGLELQLPRFSHRSVLNITQALRHMGLKDLFTSRADLRGLNGVSNDLHLSDMVQVNTFSTCGEEKVGARHHTETYPSSAIRIGRHHDVTRSPRGLNLGGEEGYIRRQRQARLTEDWLVDRRYKRSTDNASPELKDELENNNSELHQKDDNKEHTYLDISPEELTTPISREDKQLRLTETPRLRFDRPFLYMIRHNPTGIILHMGRFNPRLLP